MTAPETLWIDKKEESRYDGCLMVLNIGQDNIDSLPSEYKEKLREAVGNAHADGWITIYAFDSETGPFRIPDEFDNIEGMDHVRMMFDVCGRRDSNFNLYPTPRMEEFKKIGETIRNHERFNFKKQNLKICGSCKIDGTPVLLPISDIP